MPWGNPLLYRDSASALSQLVVRGPGSPQLPLTRRLITAHTSIKGHEPSGADVTSWENSLPIVVSALLQQGLGAVEVMIEYALSGSAGAIDVLLAGNHPATGEFSYLAIELKQWQRAATYPHCSAKVDAGYRQGNRVRPKLHPVRQIQGYCEYLVHHVASLHGNPDRIAGCALLHQALEKDLGGLLDFPQNGHGRLYTADTLGKFRDFLSFRLAPEPGGQAADNLRHAKEYPPPTTVDAERLLRHGQQAFVLLDDQALAYEDVLSQVRRPLQGTGRKRVFIARGGPGSGKTAIALKLKHTLHQQGWDICHATGSRVFTHFLRDSKVEDAPRGTKTQVRKDVTKEYRFFNQFGEMERDSLDVLLCDEAHRLRRTSVDRYTKKEKRHDSRPQVHELIEAARVPVFLLDDWQSLRPNEVGTAEYIAAHASEMGCDPVVIDLEGMFRAQGSIHYRKWVTRCLSIDVTSPETWQSDGRMELKLADSPDEMEEFLGQQVLQGFNARMMAGFCWPWNKPDEHGLVPDVRIGDWRRPWNLQDGFSVTNVPSTTNWARDSAGFGQVGCIYTAQNFEFDWTGVIIGPDLVWSEARNQFIVDRSATCDPELRPRTVSDQDVDRLVRNAYHVLLTRARMGTVVHATDPVTREALRRLIIEGLPRAMTPGRTARGAPSSIS